MKEVHHVVRVYDFNRIAGVLAPAIKTSEAQAPVASPSHLHGGSSR